MLSRMHGYNKKIEDRLRSKNTQDKNKIQPQASQGVPEPWDPKISKETRIYSKKKT